MSLFQKSVLIKYQNLQDKNAIEKAFKKYVKYFHNPEIQQNIRESKEEQYQEGFLRELFVNILSYTINPNPNFNLTTELKNEKGAKKADEIWDAYNMTREVESVFRCLKTDLDIRPIYHQKDKYI